MGTPSKFETGIGYRVYLQNEYLLRREKNPSYSLRAFARDLKLSPTYLRQVLKGTRSLSIRKAHMIAECMGLDQNLIQSFVEHVILETIDLPEGGQILYLYKKERH